MSSFLQLLSALLPDEVTFSFKDFAAGGTAGVDSLYDVVIAGDSNIAGFFDAFCIDTDRALEPSGTITAKVFSSYEPLPAEIVGNQATFPGAPSGFGNIEKPENLDLLNWILNQSFVGKTLLSSTGASLGTVTYGDVQRAIWALIDDTNSTSGIGPYSQTRANRIQSLAQTNGEGFVPTYDYTTIFGEKVVGTVGVILAPDANPSNANPYDRQFLIIGVKLAKIGDFVYEDKDADGIQDVGETGLGGVTVTLLADLNKDGTFTDMVATTTTAADGSYSFTDLIPGQYQVKFETPTGYTFSPANTGNGAPGSAADAIDSDADPTTGLSQVVTLSGGEFNKTVDAGVFRKASLGDFVFNDTNGNGIQDMGEAGVGGVTVQLINPANDSVISTTTTTAAGAYSFSGLTPGSYQVKFVAPNGFNFTTSNVGDDSKDSDANATTGLTQTVTLTSGEFNGTLDAGLVPLASLGDLVFEDKNANGIQDAGEAGIAGATVRLLNASGSVIATTTTNASGLYSFTALQPGDYQVQFVTPGGFSAVSPANAGGNDALDSDADPSNGLKTGLINLSPGENDTTNDAGFYKTASLGDFVFKDTNKNGLQDMGETGFSGVKVQLLDGNGNPVLVGGHPVTATTDASGKYLFSGLTPGQYKVKFTAPLGYDFTTPNVGDDTKDSDADITTGITQTVTLTSGQFNGTLDAGLVVEDCPSGPIGGIDLGGLTDFLFFFADGSKDANWQGATKGFSGNVAVDGIQAKERTSGGVPYAGTIYTNDSTLGAWQGIVNQNTGQAQAKTGETALISQLESDLNKAFTQINGLTATAGFENRSSDSLNGLNTQDGIDKTYVINVTSGLQISKQINITGDAGDTFVLRWDTDPLMPGYQGQVKFQSGGAIVPKGGLKAGNFISVAGDINASGGGSNPPGLPQGPVNDMGNLITGGKNFSGGGFFTGYWLTTGDKDGKTSSLSNAIFTGGWYTTSNQFSMTSGTSGVHICPTVDSLSTGLR